MVNTNKPEPPPVHNDETSVWDLVLTDMKERKEIGYRSAIEEQNDK